MIILAMTGLTIKQIEGFARSGDPRAWQNLAGAAGSNIEARNILLQLEKEGIVPILEPPLPEVLSIRETIMRLPIVSRFLGKKNTRRVAGT